MARTGALTGNCLVKRTRAASREVKRLWPTAAQWSIIRRHALKLRFWPAQVTRDCGLIVDLDWSWIQALKGKRVGELRIHETVGGHENIRLIFYQGGPTEITTLPVMWILAAMAKKRDGFTKHEIDTFAGRRLLVARRYY